MSLKNNEKKTILNESMPESKQTKTMIDLGEKPEIKEYDFLSLQDILPSTP